MYAKFTSYAIINRKWRFSKTTYTRTYTQFQQQRVCVCVDNVERERGRESRIGTGVNDGVFKKLDVNRRMIQSIRSLHMQSLRMQLYEINRNGGFSKTTYAVYSFNNNGYVCVCMDNVLRERERERDLI